MSRHIDLTAVNMRDGHRLTCVVSVSGPSETCQISVSAGGVFLAQGEGYDFEAALQLLRAELERKGVYLLCNRYRRDALATSLSRQMSNGLGCYLVKPRRPVDPDHIVDCLGPASASDVVSREEADAFIAKWKSRPPMSLLSLVGWRSWGRWRR